ncbi:DinB family protein [Kutzneria albida]|uniref:Mini-circle protein n=1 Tax=Kutzneria albida DSM 43870 TaxID=1449976 RepID=W5WA62_9PSEU|nr:DinB family protein [Kutzneria albida]AHH98028.1 hypothetical protein KALB_4666 [Kutzneria albida DSM 43870]
MNRAPLVGDERSQLDGTLELLRASVVRKATGLSEEQARRVLLPSELTTVSGLLGHLHQVENYWFGVVLGGMPDAWKQYYEVDDDAEFRMSLDKPVSRLIAEYQKQCEINRGITAGLDPGAEISFNGKQYTVRWVYLHVIKETARHAGHLDLLRELLDGATGE